MAIIQDWKIRSTQARCEETGEEFVDEQEFFTCIFDDPESDGFLRKDYSVEAWNRVRADLSPPPFSFWKSTYKAPVVEAEEETHVDTSAEGILRRFIEEDDPTTENARYILALMLERKKDLVQTDVQESEERRLLFYEHAANGDVFIVADPGLKLQEIEVVQREVADLLAAEEQRVHNPAKSEASPEGSDEGEPGNETGEGAENDSGNVGGQSLDESGEHQEDAPEDEEDDSSETPDETVRVSDE